MTPKQEAALRQAREALKLNCSSQTESPATKAIAAIDEALAEPKEKYQYGTPLLDAMTGKTEQPAQPCGYPYCGCNSKAWCKAEQQSGIKQVIDLYDSPEQPAQQDYWQEEARRYAQNAEFWRGKYEAATAQQQEPVGVVGTDIGGTHLMYGTKYVGTTPDKKTAIFFKDVPVGSPLYTSPQPSKPWVGLEESEWREIDDRHDWTTTQGRIDAAEEIEAKLREKNA